MVAHDNTICWGMAGKILLEKINFFGNSIWIKETVVCDFEKIYIYIYI